jgi:hypothetical protein
MPSRLEFMPPPLVVVVNWLKAHNFNTVQVVKMAHDDYEFQGGIVGLYTINDWLKSVILEYPIGEHEHIQNQLGMIEAVKLELPTTNILKAFVGQTAWI